MTTAYVIIVVSGGCVQAVYAASQTRIQLIDFDNLKEGDTFDLHEFTEAMALTQQVLGHRMVASGVF